MLTVDDINLLMEAVNAWEQKDTKDLMVTSVLSMMLCKNEQQAKSMLEEHKLEQKKLDESKQIRQERAILIKAKLIQLRDKLEVNDFIDTLEE
jgi:hypothetical protein